MFIRSHTFLTITAFASFALAQSHEPCRLLPTDSLWPTKDVWDAFNRSVDGRLIKTVPIGSPCHDPTFDEQQCNQVRNNWHIPEFQFVHISSESQRAKGSPFFFPHSLPNPSSIMDPIYLNKSCDPFDPRGTPCRIGAYVQYAVNVSSPHHVMETVRFVKKHNIRFVVKNTGHDYMGRSTGTGAVSVWLHNLQDIEFIPQFESLGYTGPAFKANAGVLAYNLSMAADKEGLVVVSGECPTVGFAAADQTLEFEVITAQGKFIRASPTEHKDLYWALSGGGGGTYAIVWSVTIKAHPDLPITTASLNFTSVSAPDTFWKALDAFQTTTPSLTDARIWASAQYTNTSFRINPLFAVNKTTSEVSELLRPLLLTWDQLGINYTSVIASHEGYLDAYNSIPSLRASRVGGSVLGSRLLPRRIWEDEGKLKALQTTIRQLVEEGGAFVVDAAMGTREVAGYPDNAVLPAWREAERWFGVA
ncbi:hypothetical protein V5O48_007554, partial [Marasmius crinis-equi]